jgi:hypothetical protein
MTKQENANAVPEVPIGEFPPYGFYNESDVLNLEKQPLFPKDWDGDEASWEAWFDETLLLINDLLWPEFVPGVAKWRGKSASNMGALTDADFDILLSIQSSVPLELDRYVQTPACPVGSYTHKDLYLMEDGSISDWGTYYAGAYDSKTPHLSSAVNRIIVSSFLRKVAITDMRFKFFLQRPRPYQMSMVRRKTKYHYFSSYTATTPSMICGHCLDALMTVGAIMERIISGGEDLSDESWQALEQFSVDVGDRRVMAGLHYPSDALSSWLVALRLANHVFKDKNIKRRLWSAISKRSFVYGLIVASKAAVYRPALKELAAEAKR